MNELFTIWAYLQATPLFGLTLTLAVYSLSYAVYRRFNQNPLLNPVLMSIIIIGAILLPFHIPYRTYFDGAQFVHFLLGPAVVAMAYPIWQRRKMILRQLGRLVLASLLGAASTIATAVLMSIWLGLPHEFTMGFVTKTLTTPVAMGVAEKIHANLSMAALVTLLSGIVGAVTATTLFNILHIFRSKEGELGRGYAIGTICHGVGAGSYMQVSMVGGGFAGAALSMQIILLTLLIPFCMNFFE